MSLFIERLKECAVYAVAVGVMILVFWLLSLIVDVVAWIFVLVVVAGMLYILVGFVYWLFIEPFRRSKSE